MSAHTKGPWQVHWEANVVGYPVYSIHGMSGDQKRDEATLNANARLIAAAPELLDVLQEIDQGLWQNFISVRKRPTLADITAIWELAQKWRAALSKVHP